MLSPFATASCCSTRRSAPRAPWDEAVACFEFARVDDDKDDGKRLEVEEEEEVLLFEEEEVFEAVVAAAGKSDMSVEGKTVEIPDCSWFSREAISFRRIATTAAC